MDGKCAEIYSKNGYAGRETHLKKLGSFCFEPNILNMPKYVLE